MPAPTPQVPACSCEHLCHQMGAQTLSHSRWPYRTCLTVTYGDSSWSCSASHGPSSMAPSRRDISCWCRIMLWSMAHTTNSLAVIKSEWLHALPVWWKHQNCSFSWRNDCLLNDHLCLIVDLVVGCMLRGSAALADMAAGDNHDHLEGKQQEESKSRWPSTPWHQAIPYPPARWPTDG